MQFHDNHHLSITLFFSVTRLHSPHYPLRHPPFIFFTIIKPSDFTVSFPCIIFVNKINN